jgi:hypothetical protein
MDDLDKMEVTEVEEESVVPVPADCSEAEHTTMVATEGQVAREEVGGTVATPRS